MSKAVEVYDRQGRSFCFPSIRRAARELCMDYSVVKRRTVDGNWIHRDGYVAVKVRRI